MASAVSLFILSPVVLIFLIGFTEKRVGALSNGMALAIGLTVLFLVVACGIAVVIYGTYELEKYKFLESEEFVTEYGVEGLVRQKQEQFSGKRNLGIISGIAILVLSMLWVLIPSVLIKEDARN